MSPVWIAFLSGAGIGVFAGLLIGSALTADTLRRHREPPLPDPPRVYGNVRVVDPSPPSVSDAPRDLRRPPVDIPPDPPPPPPGHRVG